MPNRVKILPAGVSAKIAAGEVVERPASVVKELVENALDAGAKKISVTLGNICRDITVRDNGRGLEPGELALALQRFSTSKITALEDLDGLTSYGFRGEALNAIAAVSRLRLRSRTKKAKEAAYVLVEGGVHSGDGVEGAPVGTSVEVINLFYNTPARAKFLKAERTERRHVIKTITRFVLSGMGADFVLAIDGEELLNTAGCREERDRLALVFTPDEAKEMLALSGEAGGICVTGHLSPPGMHRRDRGGIFFFVNRRAVESPLLAHALRRSYQTLLPSDRHPLATVFVELPPDEVDVNVHPTKREVRFRKGNHVHRVLHRTVAEALRGTGQDIVLSAGKERGEERGAAAPDFWGKKGVVQEEISDYLRGAPMSSCRQTGMGAAETGLRLLGQVDCLYIVAIKEGEVLVVDQHAAHERLLYNKFLAGGKKLQGAAQRLLEPERVDLSVAEAEAARQCLEELDRMGLELEPFGGRSFMVQAVPVDFRGGKAREFLRAMLADLAMAGGERKGNVDAAAVMACHLAVRDGERLEAAEMRAIVEGILADADGGRCPHGRPTYLRLKRDELDRKFKRK